MFDFDEMEDLEQRPWRRDAVAARAAAAAAQPLGGGARPGVPGTRPGGPGVPGGGARPGVPARPGLPGVPAHPAAKPAGAARPGGLARAGSQPGSRRAVAAAVGPTSLEERAAQIRKANRQQALYASRVAAPPSLQERIRGADPLNNNSDGSGAEDEGLQQPAQPREWEERKGYRKLAPDGKLKAELERVHRGDEEVLATLKAEKRKEARRIVSESRGGVLGSSSAGPSDMREARLAFVSQISKESDPKIKRLKQKEEEKRQREEDARRQQEAKEKRLQEWNERQQRRAVEDRELNAIKQGRWQAWEDSAANKAERPAAALPARQQPAPAPGQSSSEVVSDASRSSEELLLGRWVYGSGKQYEIKRNAAGEVQFEDVSNPNGVHGTLELVGRAWEAVLSDSAGVRLGTMRFVVRREGGGPVSLVSEFKKAGKQEWGKENVAQSLQSAHPRTAHPQTAHPETWKVVGGASHGGIIVRVGASMDSAQETLRLSTGALIREEELLGERLHFTLLAGKGPRTGWVSLNATGRFEALVVRSSEVASAASGAAGVETPPPPVAPQGRGSAEEDGCRAPMPTGYTDRLIDTDVWQCAACTLINSAGTSCCEVCGNARPRTPAPTLRISPQPQVVELEKDPQPAAEIPSGPGACPNDFAPGAQAAGAEPENLLSWLTAHRLEEYHDMLREQGFEELADLQAATQSELDKIFDDVGVKPGHILRFRRFLRGGVGSAALGGPRECPVCLCGQQEGVNVALTPCGHVFCALHAEEALKKGACPVCRAEPRTKQRIFA